jgi:hypothetical protein
MGGTICALCEHVSEKSRIYTDGETHCDAVFLYRSEP